MPMNLKDIKKELKEVQESEKRVRKKMEPFVDEIGELKQRRHELIEAWQKRCKHKKTEEYCCYSYGGYDCEESSSYKRQCMICGIVESGNPVEKVRYSWNSPYTDYEYENLNTRPPSDKQFHGTEGKNYYFNPPKRAEVTKYE